MNRQILESSANEWVRQAKNDIRQKMRDFMREVNTSTSEIAYALAITENEVNQILNGNGDISILTFAKLLIATGNVLEIKPIEESPLMMEDGVPVPPMGMRNHQASRQCPFPGHFRNGGPLPPHPGLFDEFHMRETPHDTQQHMQQPRGTDGRFKPWPRNERPVSQNGECPNFSAMEREKLVDIIKTKLWDSEIDVENASHEQLVRFLEDKNRRMNEINRERFDIDPAVVELKGKIKQTIDQNPHLRNYLKDLFQD